MMKMNHKKFDFRTAYIDLLINLVTGTMVIFLLSSLLISTITKQNEGIKKNADYIITIEWPVTIDCDVDLWIRDPENVLVSYSQKEAGLMYLERDDMGHRRSVHIINGEEVVIDPDNKEYITFRGVKPGEYIINAHLYSCFDAIKEQGMEKGTPMEVPFIVEVVKINPSYFVSKHYEMKFAKVWEEMTVTRIVIDESKNVTETKSGQIRLRPKDKEQ